MGRSPCCDKTGLNKGPWTTEEDTKLIQHIHMKGPGNWRTLPKTAGLQRCGKSCRLRWTNYLRPDIKRGRFSFEEEETIIKLHSVLGNKWSAIAARLPGRTDNEIKNYWNTHIRKRFLRNGIDPVTHAPRLDLLDLSSQLNLSNLLRLQTLLNPESLRLALNLVSPNNDLNSDILLNSHQLQENQATNFQENHFENIITQQNLGYMQEQIGYLTTNTRNQIFQENVDPTTIGLPNLFNEFSHHQMKTDLTENSSYDQSLNTSCRNNNSQNFSFDNSVLSTLLCSPPPLNSTSAFIRNGKVDEMESFCSDLLRFEIAEGLDFDGFM